MGTFFDFIEQMIDDSEEAISDAIDAFGEWAEPRVEELRENNIFSPKTEEEREFQKELKKWKEETYGPEQRDSLSKILKKKEKERKRRRFDRHVDPDSDAGRLVHKVRRAIDREEEKTENRARAVYNLFYDEKMREKIEIADHLFVRSGPITHHGIYVGDGYVIHYSTINGDIGIEIQKVSFEEFAQGRTVKCLNKKSPLIYSRDEAVRRAYSRIGERQYDLLGNNCENFVRWCRSGGEEDVWDDD